MKLKLIIVAVAAVMLGLAGCSAATPPASPPAPQSAAGNIYGIDTQDLEGLKAKYMDKLLYAYMLHESWESPNDINPDCFVYFYTTVVKEGGIGERTNQVPMDNLELVVKQYFEVDKELIRKADCFDSEKKVYNLEGLGGATDCKVTSASLADDVLIISFDVYQDAVFQSSGELTMVLLPDGQYRYASCIIE